MGQPFLIEERTGIKHGLKKRYSSYILLQLFILKLTAVKRHSTTRVQVSVPASDVGEGSLTHPVLWKTGVNPPTASGLSLQAMQRQGKKALFVAIEIQANRPYAMKTNGAEKPFFSW